ncbi:uncharacterized protein LOC114240894, partial [Bombyx mandarina]|uniref:Uncharacterized protein LOC114240894 n=1 Tax=Bombyx mandarina TaxID=7092 RepID=A0A6J2JFZ4_BOMMA
MCTITVIVILFVCHQSDGTFESRESLNVGTVLFLNADIRNKKWTTNEIGLLRAREYFQHAIPPQRILYRVDEHFVDNLLDYFKTGYSAIKREARDPVTDKTMTVALSDVIGGYLKSWVLPVTKFAYYGGSISQENALNIFNFYKEVKRYLGTDGKSWSDPDPQLLNSIEVNIESPKHVFKTRSLDNPCESLAYFIKTPVGFVVPTPYVKWNDQGSTMFLPLKNDSLVALESESASSALFKYYDVAKNCIETSGKGDQDNFDERFQTWLSDDIVPHLNDDKLYTALGSVLTLLNTSNNDDGYEETFKDYFKINTCAYFHNLCNIDFSSKKTIVICLIIFLEIVWCIPTLILLLCKKSKNDDTHVDSSDSSKRRRYIDGFKVQKYAKKGKYGRSGKTQTASRVQINTSDYEGLFIAEDVHNVGTMCSSVSRNSVGTCTQSFFSSKFCSADLAKIIYEGPSVTNKRPLKQIITQKSDANVLDARDIILPEIYRKFYSKSTPFEVEQSYSTNQGLEPSKTVTLLNGGTVPGVEYDTKHKACCCSEQVSSIDTLKNNNV